MGKMTRIRNLLIAFAMIAIAIALFIAPQYGPGIIVLIVGAGLIVGGISRLIFYITMARHMVGGMKTFFHGILFLDLGVFMMSGFSVSERLVIYYLTIILLVSGGLDIIRALESRNEGASWKFRLVSGIITLAIMVVMIVGAIFMNNMLIVVYIFCIGLLYQAADKIVSAFRKTAVIYIQ